MSDVRIKRVTDLRQVDVAPGFFAIIEASHVSAGDCRERLLALFSGAGFQRYDTDEPEVAYSERNFLAARVGPAVSEESRRAFQAALCANPPR